MNSRTNRRLTVDRVVICLFLNPSRHLLRRWNWKSAFLSALFRGTLIFLANLSAGGSSAIGAMLAEVCYRGLTSGFYSALTQTFRFAQPVWAASVIPVMLIPIISDGLEFSMHAVRGTLRLGATVAASVTFTAISTLFELYAMRNSVLIMGENSGSLLQDLQRLPNLAVSFAQESYNWFYSTITSCRWKKPVGIAAKPLD